MSAPDGGPRRGGAIFARRPPARPFRSVPIVMNYSPPFLPLFLILIIVVQRRPATRLRRRGAVSAETALPLEEMSAGDQRRFQRLMTEGVIKEGAPGRYYYDKAAVDAKVRARMPLLLGL